MPTIDEILATLTATAAHIGAERRAELSRLDSEMKRVKAKAEEWKGKAVDAAFAAEKGEAGSFITQRYQGMAQLGAAFDSVGFFNSRESDQAIAASETMATAFMQGFTGATDKSKAGGTEKGIARLIRCGNAADTIIKQLQGRLEYWAEYREGADGLEDKAEAAKIKAEADSYLKLADSPKLDKDTGKVIRPAKYLGRMGTEVRGIVIGVPGKRRGGTNRTALLAEAAALYLQHGDEFFHPEVLDAFLHNGGPAEKPEAGVEDTARRAAEAIEKLLEEFGGKNMADGAELTFMLPALKRIASQGFTSPKAAKSADAGLAPAASSPPPAPKAPKAPPATPKATKAAPPPLPQADMLTTLPEAGEEDGITEEVGGPVTPPPLPAGAPRVGKAPTKGAKAQRAGIV